MEEKLQVRLKEIILLACLWGTNASSCSELPVLSALEELGSLVCETKVWDNPSHWGLSANQLSPSLSSLERGIHERSCATL